MRSAPIVLIFATAAGVLGADSSSKATEPQVVVRTVEGRELRGVLDEGTNADQLMVRSPWPGISLRRALRWERVAAVTVDGAAQDVEALRARVKGSGNREQGRGDRGRRIVLRDVESNVAMTKDEIEPPANAKATMVAFDAYVANWDADVETDGLIVDVAPLDGSRRLVPVNATVEVELFAQQRRKLELAPESGGDTLELVERWTRAVMPEDFGPSGVRLKLPFGAITPELQPNWTASHYGLVHVRVAAPGHGVLDDTRDGVRVRPWAPTRDRLEQKTGQRFLSTEQMGRRE